MSLTRRQVRLLMISAGDHERLPDKDDSPQDEADLTAKQKEQFTFNKKHLARIRKSVKGNVQKSKIVEKYLGKVIAPKYKCPSNPVVGKKTSGNSEPQNMKELLDSALKGQGNIKVGNRLRKKLKKR